jgi:hypothetical protein
MTTNDDDAPTPEERARELARVDGDLAAARRLAAAYVATDHAAMNAVMVEVHRSGRGSKVLMAMCIVAVDFAHALDDLGALEGGIQEWLDQAAMVQLDNAALAAKTVREQYGDDDDGV